MAAIESTGHTARLTPWQKLTEPAAAVTDAAERRTARLLSSLLLLIAPLGVVSIAGQAINAGAVEQQHLVGAAAVAVILITVLVFVKVLYKLVAPIKYMIEVFRRQFTRIVFNNQPPSRPTNIEMV